MIIIVAALAMTADPPAAAGQAPAPVTAPSKDDDPIICTRDPVGSEVGTHMRSKKICMKRSDRQFIEENARTTIRNINNNGNDRMRYIPAPRAAPAPKG